jgi:hypothetical protein
MKPEVIRPTIGTWMVQPDDCSSLRHQRCDVAPFIAIAECAGEGEIVLPRKATMLEANDVIDLTSEEGILLVYEAVFAETPRAFGNEAPHLRADASSGHEF